MSRCHYCCDVIERMDNEYEELYKELKAQERVYKRHCHKEVLSQVIYHRKEIFLMLSDQINWTDAIEIDCMRDTPHALLHMILTLKECGDFNWRDNVKEGDYITDEDKEEWDKIISDLENKVE